MQRTGSFDSGTGLSEYISFCFASPFGTAHLYRLFGGVGRESGPKPALVGAHDAHPPFTIVDVRFAQVCAFLSRFFGANE